MRSTTKTHTIPRLVRGLLAVQFALAAALWGIFPIDVLPVAEAQTQGDGRPATTAPGGDQTSGVSAPSSTTAAPGADEAAEVLETKNTGSSAPFWVFLFGLTVFAAGILVSVRRRKRQAPPSDPTHG